MRDTVGRAEGLVLQRANDAACLLSGRRPWLEDWAGLAVLVCAVELVGGCVRAARRAGEAGSSASRGSVPSLGGSRQSACLPRASAPSSVPCATPGARPWVPPPQPARQAPRS